MTVRFCLHGRELGTCVACHLGTQKTLPHTSTLKQRNIVSQVPEKALVSKRVKANRRPFEGVKRPVGRPRAHPS